MKFSSSQRCNGTAKLDNNQRAQILHLSVSIFVLFGARVKPHRILPFDDDCQQHFVTFETYRRRSLNFSRILAVPFGCFLSSILVISVRACSTCVRTICIPVLAWHTSTFTTHIYRTLHTTPHLPIRFATVDYALSECDLHVLFNRLIHFRRIPSTPFPPRPLLMYPTFLLRMIHFCNIMPLLPIVRVPFRTPISSNLYICFDDTNPLTVDMCTVTYVKGNDNKAFEKRLVYSSL